MTGGQQALWPDPPRPPCVFYLGTHETSWLGTWAVPLFVSRRRLALRRGLPRALAPWALDSGGFTELNLHGAWTVPPAQYAQEVRRYAEEIGRLEWAAVQDWMCEPTVRERTGGTVREHQARTVQSYQRLRDLAPELPWAPVVQGWEPDDYRRHLDDYGAAGIDLAALPIVGVGSVCRRQHTAEAAAILRTVAGAGVRVHGFGLKVRGLAAASGSLASADSLAWSYDARRAAPLPGCTHRSCASCQRYAERWRARVLTIPGVTGEAPAAGSCLLYRPYKETTPRSDLGGR